MIESGRVYKHRNARDVVFYCVATNSDGTATGHYMNCHYFENGSRPDLFLCTEDLFTIDIKPDDWRLYNDSTINI